MSIIVEGSGLPLDRVRIMSPFDARVRYNAYSALVIIERHQRRHVRQAEEVWPGSPHSGGGAATL